MMPVLRQHQALEEAMWLVVLDGAHAIHKAPDSWILRQPIILVPQGDMRVGGWICLAHNAMTQELHI